MEKDTHLFNYRFMAEIYDKMISESGQISWHKNRKPFILNLAKLYGKNGILNLGCGTGKLSLFLAKNGYKVVGIDLSEPMLQVAQNKMGQLSAEFANNVEFIQGNMVNFSYSQEFSLVTISGGVFCHLMTQEEQIQCFKSIYKHLKEDGILCMDTIWPMMELMVEYKNSEPKRRIFRSSFHLDNGNRIDRYDELNYILESQKLIGKHICYEYNTDGKIIAEHEFPMHLRFTFPSEMRLLFELCGFVIISENSNYTQDPIKYPTRITWVVKKKNKKRS